MKCNVLDIIIFWCGSSLLYLSSGHVMRGFMLPFNWQFNKSQSYSLFHEANVWADFSAWSSFSRLEQKQPSISRNSSFWMAVQSPTTLTSNRHGREGAQHNEILGKTFRTNPHGLQKWCRKNGKKSSRGERKSQEVWGKRPEKDGPKEYNNERKERTVKEKQKVLGLWWQGEWEPKNKDGQISCLRKDNITRTLTSLFLTWH